MGPVVLAVLLTLPPGGPMHRTPASALASSGVAPPAAVEPEDEPMPGAADEPLPGVEEGRPSASRPSSGPTSSPKSEAPASGVSSAIALPGSRAAPAPEGVYEQYSRPEVGPATPGLLLSWRTFAAVPIGAPAGREGARAQRFQEFSGEFYPVSQTLRLGLASSVGLGGNDTAGGRDDFFLAERGIIGIQWPRRLAPYLEGSAGLGVLRRSLFSQDVFTLLYTVGIDCGLAFRLYGKATVATSIGWMRPVYWAAVPTGHVSIYTDALVFRVAAGF